MMKYIRLYQLNIMSIKTNCKPRSIRFFKKDLSNNKYHSTHCTQFDKQTYYYNMYVEVVDIWQKEQGRRTFRSTKDGKMFANLSNRSTQSTIHDQTEETHSQTITHGVFPVQNSKKAIFRLKINKSLQKGSKIRQFKQFESIVDDLNINQKLIANRQQKSILKVHQPTPKEQNSHSFYLNKKQKKILVGVSEDIQTIYNINQITPW